MKISKKSILFLRQQSSIKNAIFHLKLYFIYMNFVNNLSQKKYTFFDDVQKMHNGMNFLRFRTAYDGSTPAGFRNDSEGRGATWLPP